MVLFLPPPIGRKEKMEEVNFLICTDFHASQRALAGLDRLLIKKECDAVLMLGDLINPWTAELPYVESFIKLVKETHSLPLFGLHGNNEPAEAYQIYRQRGINVHLESRQFGDYNITGIGGFAQLDEAGFEDLNPAEIIINRQTIFLTHVPPENIKPSSKGPLVHLSGHLHRPMYTKNAGDTLLVQCPAGQSGYVTSLNLPEKTVKFTKIFNS